MSGMNFLLGIATDEYVILSADKNAFAFGAINLAADVTKETKLGENLYMITTGEPADADNFSNWAQANFRLYQTRNGYELSPQAGHHWLRQSIAHNLRTEDFWQVNLLLGGYDKVQKKPFLGSIDYLGNGIPDQKYLFSGFPGRFCYGILDSLYKKDMTVEEGLDAVTKCLTEVKKRVIVKLTDFSVLVIDKDGVKHMPDIQV